MQLTVRAPGLTFLSLAGGVPEERSHRRQGRRGFPPAATQVLRLIVFITAKTLLGTMI